MISEFLRFNVDIIVCIKQVPDIKDVKIDPHTHTLVREGVESIINPYDKYAIEEGIRVKERYGGKVTAISMGPPQAKEALKEAISCGVDEAVLLCDRAFAGADTLATTYTLAKGIDRIGRFDLIICGKQTIDGDTAQVGPGLAERLDIPYVSYVRKIEIVGNKYARVERMMDDGYDILEMDLPALMTVTKEVNEPRLPSLKGEVRAASIEIPMYTAKDLDLDINKIGLAGSATKVIKIFPPPKKGQYERIEGTLDEQVGTLLKKLKNLGVTNIPL